MRSTRPNAAAAGRAQIFTPDLHQRIVEKGLARTELVKAWEMGHFALYYQPQVLLDDGVLCGAEALIRWVHPTRGVLAPGAFLPLLETDSLAMSVGGWIIDEACRQTAAWRATVFPGFTVAVNLFSLQFKSGDIVQEVTRALERHSLDPSALELEITENTILKSDDRILRQLRRLRDLGVGLAFDDFGTGFASLSMLRQYPVSKIKIDRSFVSGADVCEKDGRSRRPWCTWPTVSASRSWPKASRPWSITRSCARRAATSGKAISTAAGPRSHVLRAGCFGGSRGARAKGVRRDPAPGRPRRVRPTSARR